MAIGYVLYNAKAGSGDYQETLDALKDMLKTDIQLQDVMQLTDYAAFLQSLSADDYIVVAGGDGTLNHFINNVDGLQLPCEVLYYPVGSGNDFAREFGKERGCAPFDIKQWLTGLPSVTVKGKSYRFINGVGYGIDGYCCEVGDELRKIPGKKVDYTGIAIKGLLFHYKPTNAKVTVDGKTSEFKKVWIAPTMLGKYYGGGMMPCPEQDRNNPGKLSVMVFHGTGKLRTLLIFPSLFKGQHVKHTKHVAVLSGKQITVEFDEPRQLQIDGETILDVTSYTAYAVGAREEATV